MLLDFEQLKSARIVVERIIGSTEINDLEDEIRNFSSNIPEEKRREFCRHINSLFLNVLLNRLDSTPEGTQQKVIEARRIIVNLLNEL